MLADISLQRQYLHVFSVCNADEQIWHSFSLLLLFWFIVGQYPAKLLCKRMLCKLARAVRYVTSREKDLTAPVIRVFKENIVKSVGMICFY